MNEFQSACTQLARSFLDVAKPDLTVQDLRLLAPAAARNAQGLLADAEILLEYQRWSRAHALAILAGEEASKAYACASALASGRPTVPRRDLEMHNRKLILARLVTHHIIAMAEWRDELFTNPLLTPEELANIARQDNESKQHGFYVDIASDGSLQQPSDISEAEARNAVAGVKDLTRWASGFTSERMLSLFDELSGR